MVPPMTTDASTTMRNTSTRRGLIYRWGDYLDKLRLCTQHERTTVATSLPHRNTCSELLTPAIVNQPASPNSSDLPFLFGPATDKAAKVYISFGTSKLDVPREDPGDGTRNLTVPLGDKAVSTWA